MSSKVECPLCTQIGFPTVDALRVALVSAASRNLTCPICQTSLTGLDKLTIHLFSHTLPQQELQNSVQCNNRNNVSLPGPHVMAPPSTVLNSTTVITQELNPKIGVLGNDIFQNIGNFQSERPVVKTLETASMYNQDISNLLYWLPVSSFPDKLVHSSLNAAGSVNSDVSHTRMVDTVTRVDQESENVNRLENGLANKSTSYIIVSIPPLPDLKKQCEIKLPLSNDRMNSNESNLSEVSNLSGKLLMLDCSNNVTYNNGVSVDKSPKQYTVGISLPATQQPVHNTVTSHIFPANQEVSNRSRETSSLSCASDVKNGGGNDVNQLNQSDNDTSKQPSATVRCHLCHIQFADSNILTLHHQLVHEGSNPVQHRIESQDKQSSAIQNERLSDNKDEERFQCHMCSKTFHMQGSLMVHIRVAHTAPSLVGLASRIKESTSATFPTSAASTQASATGKSPKDPSLVKANDNKQWECTECGKFFTTKYFLKKHKRLHTGEMPYSCPTCSKSFTFQQSYHKHLLYHSDEKPHTCADCGRSFKELSTLHNHQRIHTGEKPWACETCGKCFRQRVSYLVHRRIHTGAMPYCCTACNRSFRYKVSQRTHKCTAQPPGSVVRQPGDLLQRLLFGNAAEECSSQNPGDKKEDGEHTGLTHGQTDSGPFREQHPTEQTKSPVGSAQSNEPGTHFLYSPVDSDKPAFTDGLGTTVPDFNFQNFTLQQQILSNVQGGNNLPQGSTAMQNVSVNKCVETVSKQSAPNEKVPMNVGSSNWCMGEESARKNMPNFNSSSLVVVVNDKETVIPVTLPDPRAPVALLQVLQKEKCVPNNEFSGSLPVSTISNNCNLTSAADTSKHNMILSTPYVPDFVSMVISATNQHQSSGSACSDSNVPIGDPFQWEVALDMPNDGQNDNVNNNACASQETIDSLQNLLFGGPSANM